MNIKKYTFVFTNKPTYTSNIKDIYFLRMIKVSPYSNKTEQQRLNELNKSVSEAKAALETFTYDQPSNLRLVQRVKKLFLPKEAS
ncbi:hypothetical protein [Acinetobacter sp.]|uniref:hypothetical protein n=1 Tax=Acinetobacter sp. TaxID=472 RepID=UPI0031CE69D7